MHSGDTDLLLLLLVLLLLLAGTLSPPDSHTYQFRLYQSDQIHAVSDFVVQQVAHV